MMELNEKNKAQVRSWLYELLSRLEVVADVEGEKTERQNEVVIKLTFKNLQQNSRRQSLENEIAKLKEE